MNVYDFDNTIYDGESVVDFYLFALKRHPHLLWVLPKIFQMLIKYKLCLVSHEELLIVAEKYALKLLHGIDFAALIVDFWDANMKKIKKFYLEQKSSDDVILSASWTSLIEEACRRLGIKYVIASSIDLETGEILRLCFREKKVDIFRNKFPDGEIEEFYTDSMNDAPMFALAKRSFLVKGNKVEEIKYEV